MCVRFFGDSQIGQSDTMDDKDKAEKEKARRSRTTTTMPGAEQASLLDQRIAAKQSRASTGGSNIGSSGGGRARQLNDLESDIAAKTRAAAPVGRAADVRASNQLNQLEQDVAAKTRAAAKPHSANMSAIEQDRDSKNRARNASVRQDLNDIETRIVAKTKRATSSRSINSLRSNPAQREAQNQLEILEDSVSRKLQGSTPIESTPRGKEGTKAGYDPNDMDKDESYRSQGQSLLYDDRERPSSREAPLSPGGKRFNEEGFDGHRSNPAHTTTVAHGIANDPGVEYGTYPIDGNGGYDDSLAVAVAVAEDEDDAFIPAAIEFDPDSKPPIYKNRRFRFYVVTATILLAAVGVGAALGVTSSQKNSAPTFAPTTMREGLDIDEKLVSIVGEAVLADSASPHARAANWLVNEDALQLAPEADNLVQRYLLALFYLSTTEDRPWLSCNPPVGDEDSNCTFAKLAQVFPQVEYENITWGRWLSPVHECMWAGVLCDEFNQTRALELPGQQIRSTFPSEIALMPYLQSLTFNWNELYGTMPSELASMKHLLNIELHYNFFTGQVPPEWYSSQALQRINFAGNYLSGTIPSEVGQLSTMKGFFSFENNIGGTIPTEVGQMKFLSFTRWGRNSMVGTMPSEIGNLEKLQELWAHRNLFTGVLPSEMGKMRDMGDLRLHYNQFSGSVPEEHYGIPLLRRWDLYDMNLTSPISTSIGKMSNLQTYRIRANNFYGTVPTEIGLLMALDEVWIHYNDLTGEIPIEVCALRGPTGVLVLDADCGPTNSFGPPKLQCMVECCTACCDSVTGYCLRENTPTFIEDVPMTP